MPVRVERCLFDPILPKFDGVLCHFGISRQIRMIILMRTLAEAA